MRPGSAWWQGQKDLNPRHAVLEWMLVGASTHKQSRVCAFCGEVARKTNAVWCCIDAMKKSKQNQGKFCTAVNKEINLSEVLRYGQFIQTIYDYPCIITKINKSDRCICFIFAEVSILYFYSENKSVMGSSPAPLFQRPAANHLKYTESCLYPYKIQQIPKL